MTDDAPLRADLVLRRASRTGRVGTDRIALLRAIRDTGSIAAAAKTAGLSYKAAWDAVQVLNNLVDRPLVLAAPGGRDGGVTTVTAAGERIIFAFEAAETELAGVFARLEEGLANGGGANAGAGPLSPLLWGLIMKTSARNLLRGTVTRVTPGAVNAEVALAIADGVELIAIITMASVADLDLAPGMTALAIVKSSFVILVAGDDAPRTSARNSLAGTVTHREDGAVNSEITLELASGKTLTATVTRESAETLALDPGTRATALIKASHVILAVE